MMAGAVSFMRWSTPGSWRTVTNPWLAMVSGVSDEGWLALCRSRICRTSSAFETVVNWIALVTALRLGNADSADHQGAAEGIDQGQRTKPGPGKADGAEPEIVVHMAVPEHQREQADDQDAGRNRRTFEVTHLL